MGKAQSSFLTDEPFAALFCLLAISIVLAPTAVHAGTKSFYMVMLPVLPHYFAHLIIYGSGDGSGRSTERTNNVLKPNQARSSSLA